MTGSLVLKLFVLLLLFVSCADDRLTEGVCYDFLANIGDAEVSVKGVKSDPLLFNAGRQPWTEEEALFCPILPRALLRFRDVPVAEDARLIIGYGFSHGQLSLDSAPKGAKIVLEVLVNHQGRQKSLKKIHMDARQSKRGQIHTLLLPIPKEIEHKADFIFKSDLSAGLSAYGPVWSGLTLRSKGRKTMAQNRNLRLRGSLLDHGVKPLEKPGPFRADFDEEKKQFYPAPKGRILVTPIPCETEFKVKVFPNANLSFGMSVINPNKQEKIAIAFQVLADQERIFYREVVARENGVTLRINIPLEDQEEKEVSMVLKTSLAEGGDPSQMLATWIHPVLEEIYYVPKQKKNQGKNILLLVVDALRADHMSLYGYERPTTPNLDAVAQQGVVFDNLWAQSSWTIPSTASLLTGQYAYTHGLYDACHWHIVPGVSAITEDFLKAGWTTGAFISNKLISEDNNFSKGFETFQEIPFSSAAQLNRAFLNWLENHGDSRFFAYLHYMDPHMPYAPPGQALNRFNKRTPFTPDTSSHILDALTQFLTQSEKKESLESLSEQQKDQVAQLKDLYDGAIAYWDERFRLLMEELDQRGVLENTIVVVTSDHGEEFMEHGFFEHGQSLHRELLHAPLVILNANKPKARDHSLRGLIDVAPTLLNLGGISHGKPDASRFAGKDLFDPLGSHEFLFAQTAHGLFKKGENMVVKEGVFSNKLKCVWNLNHDTHLLYDREADPFELNPLKNQLDTSIKLKDMIRQWRKECRARAPYNISVYSQQAFEKLRSMGYVK